MALWLFSNFLCLCLWEFFVKFPYQWLEFCKDKIFDSPNVILFYDWGFICIGFQVSAIHINTAFYGQFSCTCHVDMRSRIVTCLQLWILFCLTTASTRWSSFKAAICKFELSEKHVVCFFNAMDGKYVTYIAWSAKTVWLKERYFLESSYCFIFAVKLLTVAHKLDQGNWLNFLPFWGSSQLHLLGSNCLFTPSLIPQQIRAEI